MKKIALALFLSTLLIGLSNSSSFAQCNIFTKKKCLPKLSPFIHNGQLNSASLGAGETAELELTFYSGQDYRLLICAQEIFEGVSFKLKTKENKILFDSAEKEKLFWDFKVANTQQLTLEVTTAAPKNKTGIVESGCVSVLVGFKKP